MAAEHTITDLEALVGNLSPDDRERFHRIYRVATVDAPLRVPQAMASWAADRFGSVEAVESQRVVRVVNMVTGEGTLFNPLRAQRPLEQWAEEGSPPAVPVPEDDPLARPLELTPEDPFGRLHSEHGVTAANVARYDALHSLVVFDEPNPLAFTRASLAGHLALTLDWIKEAHRWDPEARYPYLLWNCLWRAGGSLVHGHFQVTLARGTHYARIERLRHDAEAYRRRHGASYFDDLFVLHRALGCGHQVGESRVLAHLTPLREKEVMVLAPRLEDDAVEALYQALAAFRDRLGVVSFNMGVLMPPVAPVSESWEGFPVVARIVDRGDLNSRTSDVGGMELFAESVVGSDPFAVAAALQPAGEGRRP